MNRAPYNRPRILDRIGLDGHRVIEANAGTGKTFTLEHLVVEMIVKAGARLEQILAVTFTERATAELRARVRAAIERALEAAREGDAAFTANYPTGANLIAPLQAALFSFERAPIHTIHSFCQKILTDLAFHTGTRFGIETADGATLFHEAFRAVMREKQIANPGHAELIAQWSAKIDELDKMLYEAHKQRYEPGAVPPDDAAASLEAKAADLILPAVRERLKADKFRRGVIDFNDMLELVYEALERDRAGKLAAALRARFRFALIDEFQDTDEVQWGIFRKIFVDGGAHGGLYLIGDPKQAIYSFRGADVHAYLKARERIATPANPRIDLVENFRSTEPMIEAINAILDQNAKPPLFNGPITYEHPVSCGRKELRATAGEKDLVPVTLIQAPRDGKMRAPKLRAALSRRIAATIKELVDSKAEVAVTDGAGDGPALNYRDIFILTHANRDGINLAEYLRAEGIPYAFYKREGLFETAEAGDVLDLLRAVAAPNIRSNRMKAWATPFFAVGLRELWKIGEPEPSDPLIALILRWHAMAEDGNFAAMFESMIDDSGLAARQLFLASSMRELTNYEHIFELLLEEALREGWSLGEIIDHLAAYTAGLGQPAGEDTNLMRLESERAAVQIMTVHKAKGLEARVVFVFGGFSRRTGNPDTIKIYHDDQGVRRLALGKSAQDANKDRIEQEEKEEDQRLLYVAITRARAKLYLPYLPEGSTATKVNGRYAQLNSRLRAMDANGQLVTPLFETIALEVSRTASERDASTIAVAKWMPPQKLLDDPSGAKWDGELAALARKSAALETLSYTSMQRRAAASAPELEPAEYKLDLEPAADASTEPRGGAAAGTFLHEVIERLDLPTLAAAKDLAAWGARAEVREIFDAALERNQVPERERWMVRGPEIIFNTLKSPIAAGATTIPALAGCKSSREMEFTFPIPESAHSLLDYAAGQAGAKWRIERGVYVGFVDFVFRHEDRVYFADWKSNLLESYEPDAVAEYARNYFSLQAKIYTIGVLRLLGIRSQAEYEARFGGLLYLFLRGIAPDGGGRRGVYFHRPRWPEIANSERALMTAIAELNG